MTADDWKATGYTTLALLLKDHDGAAAMTPVLVHPETVRTDRDGAIILLVSPIAEPQRRFRVTPTDLFCMAEGTATVFARLAAAVDADDVDEIGRVGPEWEDAVFADIQKTMAPGDPLPLERLRVIVITMTACLMAQLVAIRDACAPMPTTYTITLTLAVLTVMGRAP